ncbi:30114_t:CDS:2, partial [Gigaspora margarita]
MLPTMSATPDNKQSIMEDIRSDSDQYQDHMEIDIENTEEAKNKSKRLKTKNNEHTVYTKETREEIITIEVRESSEPLSEICIPEISHKIKTNKNSSTGPDSQTHQFSPNNLYISSNPKSDIHDSTEMETEQKEQSDRHTTEPVNVESDYEGEGNNNQGAIKQVSSMKTESTELQGTNGKPAIKQSYRNIIVNPRKQINKSEENTGDINWKEIVKQKYIERINMQRQNEFDSDEWNNNKILQAFNDETEIRIISIYLPSNNQTLSKETQKEVTKWIKSAKQKNYQVVTMGDFNDNPENKESKKKKPLFQAISKQNLISTMTYFSNNKPTWQRGTSTLDTMRSDHSVLCITWKHQLNISILRRKRLKRKIYRYEQMDEDSWQKFKDEIEEKLRHENLDLATDLHRALKKINKTISALNKGRFPFSTTYIITEMNNIIEEVNNLANTNIKNIPNQELNANNKKRYSNFTSNTTVMIDSILKRYRDPVKLNNIAKSDHIINSPNEIKKEIKDHFEKWTKKIKLNMEFWKEWQPQYEQIKVIDETWYKDISSVITKEEMILIINSAPNSKAP